MGLRETSPTLWHILMCLVVITVAAMCMALAGRRVTPREARWMWFAFAAHIAGSFALLFVIMEVYGIGDVVTFFRQGELLVRYVRAGGSLSEVVALVFQRDVDFPFVVIGIGSPTGTMSGLGGLLLLLTSSIWAGNLIAAMLAYSGQVALYFAVRPQLLPAQYPRALAAIMLVPSVTFWCGGLVKEALALAGVGWLCLALSYMARGRWATLLIAAAAIVVIGLSKPYFLMPLGLAASVWVYWREMERRYGARFALRPVQLFLIGSSAVAGIIVFGELFPSYSLENLGEQAALQQFYGARVEGGSDYDIGATGRERSLTAQLAFAPLGLASAWFRPFLFEVSNAAVLVNSIEATLLTLLLVRVLWRRGLMGTLRELRGSPLLMFCLTFAVLAGVGIGVASTNLGSLSRYRAPMMPFYVTLLLLLDPPRPATSPEPAMLANRRSHSSTTRSRS